MNAFIQKYLLQRKRKSTRTVRFLFSAVFTAAMLLGAAAITSTSDVSYIRLATSAATVESGQRFSIDVYAYAHVPVNAVDITLHFDPDAVTVLSVDRGRSVLTIWTEEPVIKNGTVSLSGGTFRRGFVKEHKIATLDMVAKETGQSTFSVSDVMLLAGDGAGSPVSTTETDSSSVSLYVYDENTSPENIGVDVKIKVVSDIDGDGKVTLTDISAFMAAWHNKNTLYDFNNDGKMSFRDFSIILANFFF